MKVSAQSVQPGWRAYCDCMGLRKVISVELLDDPIEPITTINFESFRPGGGSFPQYYGPMEEIEVEKLSMEVGT